MKSKTLLILLVFFGLLSCENSNTNTNRPQEVKIDHYGICRNYANQMAKIAMEQICPNTGKNSYSKVTSYEYDRYDDRYEIGVELYWTGRPWTLADFQKYNIDGVLYVYEDGDYDLEISYENHAVKVTNDNNTWFDMAGLTVGALVVMSEYDNNY